MEDKRRDRGVQSALKIQMLCLGAIGCLLVVTIGVASADDTPTSYPALPDVELAPAAVVAAGADSIDTNAVARLTTYGTLVQRGTVFQLDDGRLGTVSHALIDARRANLEIAGADGNVSIDEAITNGAAISRLHDVSAIATDVLPAALSVADQPGIIGQQVALGGIPADGRITTITGTIIARTTGADYGVGRPDVYVITATVDEGWSGGPVVDGNGDVIAIIVGIERRSGVTLAVPIEYLPTP